MAVPSNHRPRSPSGHPHPQGPEAPPGSALHSPRPVLPRTPASPASTQFLESSWCFQPPDYAFSFHPSNRREKHVLFPVSSSTAFSSVPSPPRQQDHGAEVLTGFTHHGHPIPEHPEQAGALRAHRGHLLACTHPSHSALKHSTLWACLQSGHFPDLAKISTQAGPPLFQAQSRSSNTWWFILLILFFHFLVVHF